MLLRELFEQKQSVGFIFGRFNPPHKGHRAAWEMLSENSAWYVGTNKSTQGPKDPLPYDVKIKAMEAIWPEVKGHIVPSQSWLTLASEIYKKHGDVELKVYTDEEWVLKALNQYNGVEGKSHGVYNFSQITSVPTPRLSSATALRTAVANNDRAAFANAAGVPAETSIKGTPFFDLVAEYLGQYKKEGANGVGHIETKKKIKEAYKLQLERDPNMYVLHIVDTKTGKRTEVRGKSGYETVGYDSKDRLHQLLDRIGKTANISELINGEVVTINPKHPDAEKAKSATDRAYNEAFDTDVEWIKGAAPQGASVYAAKVDDAYIEITYKPMNKGVYISFTRGARMNVTGEGSQNKIFGAVINHIKKWVDANKPQEIYFSAFKPRTGAFGSQDTTRSGLYRKMVQRFASQNGYDYDVEDGGNEDTFILTKKQQPTQTNESATKLSGKEMLNIFQNMHHDSGMNKKMDQYILVQNWQLRDFTPDMFPDEEEFFDYDDPFDRVIDVDYNSRVDLSQPIIVGPRYKNGKYSVIDGNHRAANAQASGKTIKGYFPVKKVTEALDQPYPVEWNLQADDHWFAWAKDEEIQIQIKTGGNRHWTIRFKVNETMDKTGAGDEFRTFATVKAAIQEWWAWASKNAEVDVITFSAEKIVDTSRSRLYNRFAQQFARTIGYDMEVVTGRASDIFYLKKPGLEENFADGKKIGIHRSSEDFAVIDLSKSADGTFWLNGIDNTDWDSTVTTGQGVDMAFEISPQAKLASYDDIDKYSIGELENMGYDGVRMKDGDNVAYQIWNTKILKRTKLGENFADGKITEVLDNPYPINWTEKGPDVYVANSQNNLEIFIADEENEGVWEISFMRNNRMRVTQDGDEFRIFATVKSAIAQWWKHAQSKKLPINKIVFSAAKDDSEGRSILYKRFASMFAQKIGYRIETKQEVVSVGIDGDEINDVFILSNPNVEENITDDNANGKSNAGLGLTIFDIDDTLMHTTAQIKVVKDGRPVRSLTNQEFNTYKLKPGEEFDFGEFRNAEKFRRESKPMPKMIAKLKAILANAGDSKVIMLTARADFDDKETFLDTFRDLGIDMSRVHVHRAGNTPGNPAQTKAIWIRKYLETGKYARVRLYDDAMSNIKMFNQIAKEYPDIKFYPYLVTHDGSIKTVRENFAVNNLTELFDKPYPYTLDIGSNKATARISLPDGTNLRVGFLKGKTQWDMAFDRDGTFDADDQGDQFKVMATVVAAFKEFVEKVKPAKITFDADKDSTNSRVDVYAKMLNRYADKMGYGFTAKNPEGDSIIQYTLTKGKPNVKNTAPQQKDVPAAKTSTDLPMPPTDAPIKKLALTMWDESGIFNLHKAGKVDLGDAIAKLSPEEQVWAKMRWQQGLRLGQIGKKYNLDNTQSIQKYKLIHDKIRQHLGLKDTAAENANLAEAEVGTVYMRFTPKKTTDGKFYLTAYAGFANSPEELRADTASRKFMALTKKEDIIKAIKTVLGDKVFVGAKDMTIYIDRPLGKMFPHFDEFIAWVRQFGKEKVKLEYKPDSDTKGEKGIGKKRLPKGHAASADKNYFDPETATTKYFSIDNQRLMKFLRIKAPQIMNSFRPNLNLFVMDQDQYVKFRKWLSSEPVVSKFGGTDVKIDKEKTFSQEKGRKFEDMDPEEEDDFHVDLDKLVHKYFGHSSDEKKIKH